MTKTTAAPAATVKAEPAETRANLARLPDAQMKLRSAAADAIVTRHGKLARVFQEVELSLARGEIYTIDKGKTFMIQADGYTKLNSVAGMQVVQAPTVAVDGVHVPNPCVVRDPLTGQIKDIFLRSACVGRSESGNPIVTTQTIHYSPDQYFKAELFAAVKIGEHWDDKEKGYVSDAGWSDAGRLVAFERLDRSTLKEYEAVYPVDDTIAMVVDLRSAAISKVLNNRNENFKFALRKAQTILERRLLCKQPGMPRPKIPGTQCEITIEKKGYGNNVRDVIVDAKVKIRVLGWVELDTKAMGGMLKVAGAIEAGDEMSLPNIVHDLGQASSGPTMDDENDAPVDDRPPIVENDDGTIDVEHTSSAAPAQASEPAAKPQAAPAPSKMSVKATLATQIQANLKTLRSFKSGSKAASDLLNKFTDGESELIDHKEETLREMLAASLAAIETAKKAPTA